MILFTFTFFYVMIFKNAANIGEKMEEKNKKILLTISFLRKFISIFFKIFFNIFIYKNVNDLGFILQYNLVGVIFEFILGYFAMRFITSKNAKFIFNASFIELIICILLLLLLKENIIKIVYLFRIFYALEQVSYYNTKEVAIMGVNTHKTMNNYLANEFIVDSLATILTPLFSGFIIEKFSYSVLLIILSIEAFIIIMISLKLKSFYIDDKQFNMREFINKAKSYPHLKDAYRCMFYRRISLQGAITDLLPVLLFLRVGTELSVGTYNSIFAIISILCLYWLKYKNKKKQDKKFYTLFAIILFASSIILVYHSNLTTLLIYYLFVNSLGTIIESESCSMIYKAINMDGLSQYKREHEVTFGFYMVIGQILSYGVTYLLYHYFYDANILAISISIMMFFLIISCIYLRKVEKFFYTLQ